jgi:hypothetical protein
MSSAVAGRQNLQPRSRRLGLWFGLIGGGIAWTLHLMSAYAIAEFGCVGGMGSRSMAGISLVAWMELAATAISVCLAMAATIAAYRLQCQLMARTPSESAHHGERITARAGLLASGLFTFVILFESIPIFFYLRDC